MLKMSCGSSGNGVSNPTTLKVSFFFFKKVIWREGDKNRGSEGLPAETRTSSELKKEGVGQKLGHPVNCGLR